MSTVEEIPDLDWCGDCQRERLACDHRDTTDDVETPVRSTGSDLPSKAAFYVQDARTLLAQDEYVQADLTLKALLRLLEDAAEEPTTEAAE